MEVELGISLRHVVEELAGGLRGGARLRAVLVSGPLGGVIAADQLDVEMSQAALAAAGAALGHGGVVVLDERVGAPELVSQLWSFAPASIPLKVASAAMRALRRASCSRSPSASRGARACRSRS